MKCELKRQTKGYVILYGIVIAMGLLVCFADDDIFGGLIVIAVGAGFMINEFIRRKAPVLTFDEKGFCIGENSYSYTDIESIDSFRLRNITFVKIIIGGETVYKFDNSYKNAKEFVKQLTLNGVEHNLYS